MLVNRWQYSTETVLFNPQFFSSSSFVIRTIVLHHCPVHPGTCHPSLCMLPSYMGYCSTCNRGSRFLSVFWACCHLLGLYNIGIEGMDGWMSTECWWNDTGRRTVKYWEKTLLQCYIGLDKSLHVLVWDWTWLSTTIDWQVTTWTMVEPAGFSEMLLLVYQSTPCPVPEGCSLSSLNNKCAMLVQVCCCSQWINFCFFICYVLSLVTFVVCCCVCFV